MLAEQAAVRPESPAAIGEHGTATFTDLAVRAARTAGALRSLGIRRGSRVGILDGNGVDWLGLAFGAMQAGATVVPFSTWSTEEELEFLIADSGIAALFCRSTFLDRDFEQDLARIVVRSRAAMPAVFVLGGASGAGFPTLESLLAGAPGPAASETALPEDDAYVLYTSGSTSRPKGVRLTHGAIVENGFNIAGRQGLRAGDRVFLPAPLFWSYGAANALPAAFSHGAALVLPTRFEPAGALAMIEQHRCTAIYTLPAITNALLRDKGFSPARTGSLRTGLTIGSPRDFMAAAEGLGIPDLCNIYGATETCGNCAVTPHDWPLDRRAVCQGTPLPGQVLRFRDPETGMLLPDGETGLVEVSGYVSPGYSGASAVLNADTFTTDGFYRTGDLGRLDADGAFVFVGRDSDMIKRAGINVSPMEIEDVIRTVAGVAQAAVAGAPDERRGESIVAFLVAADGAGVDVHAAAEACRRRLSKYKWPDRFEVIAALPLTATGKLQRKELRKLAAALPPAISARAAP